MFDTTYSYITEDTVSGSVVKDYYTVDDVDTISGTLNGKIGNFSNVIYLTYNGSAGTQSGENGCMLVSSGIWNITEFRTVYYVDSSDGDMIINIPDANSSNIGKTMSFMKPKSNVDSNNVTIQTESGQNICVLTAHVLSAPGDYVQMTAVNIGLDGSEDYMWRPHTFGRSVVNKIIVSEKGSSFNDLQNAIDYINFSVSGDLKYQIEIEPGVYSVSGTITTNNSNILAVNGAHESSVILKPTTEFATELIGGASFISIPYTTSFSNFTIDASDYPTVETTGSGKGISVEDDSYEEVRFFKVNLRGFRYGLYSDVESNIYCNSVDIRRCGTALRLDGDYLLFDADNIYVEDCWDKHIHVSNGEAYFSDAEFNSTNTISGTAVYVEGTDTYVELFGGTNIWGVNKNLLVKDTASLLVDNCVIEDAAVAPGIEQKDTSTLRIINSRTPLSNDSLDIQDPTNVYINAYDSDNQHLTIGTGSDVDQTILTIETGRLTKPKFRYDADYYGYKGLIYENPTDGEKAIFGVEAVNEEPELTCIAKGSNAWNYGTYFNLYSDQNGSLRGWEIGKGTGSQPPVTFKYQGTLLALQLNYDGTTQFNSGVNINKVLDEDTMNSDDRYALATQQSIKAYADNTIESEIITMSGILQNNIDEKADIIHTHIEDDITDLDKYTQMEVDNKLSTLSGSLSDSENINYINTNWNLSNVNEALNELTNYTENILGSGRTSPELPLSSSGSTLVVSSGEGFISYEDYHRSITWSGTSVDVTGYSEDFYYVYVDYNGNVNISTSDPGHVTSIHLGFFYCDESEVAIIQNCGCILDNTLNRISEFANRLGVFIYDSGGLVQAMSENPRKIISTACKAQHVFKGLDLPERSSNDVGNGFYCVYKTADVGWETEYYFTIEEQGVFVESRYNDITASGSIDCSSNCTFTNGSNIVTCVNDITDEIDDGDFIYLTSDTDIRMSLVSGTNWTGSQTDITLINTYKGSSTTGSTTINKALPPVPNDKYCKHLIARTLDGNLFVIPSQSYFDSYTEALNAGSPEVPSMLELNNIKMAYVYTMPGSGSLTFQDIRPLPFHSREGGKQTGGTVTDHGDLSGLLDDDHSQYVLSDGTRNFSAAISYNSHPSFINDTQIIDKKYVDDEISGLTTDHGELIGLGDDDHPQYHNDTRGDARYYTQTQLDNGQLDSRYYTETEVDNWTTNHTAAGSTDHDNRYYTETEVNGLLTSLSGSLSNQIDAIETGDLPSCQVRRTTDFTFPSSWGDVTFDTTDFENDTDILEHDDSNTERINIKETGLYFIIYKFQVLRSSTNYSYARILKNGTTLVDGSESEVNTYTNEVQMLSGNCIVSLQQNDYITLQAYENSYGSTTGTDDTSLLIISMKGLRGNQGPAGQDGQPGTGSTINISQDGSIEASSVSNLNFEGDVTVTSGSEYTTVNVGAPKTIQCYSTSTMNVNTGTPVAIPWDGEDIKDDDCFTHSTSTNNSRVYVDENGWYEVNYNLYYTSATYRSNVRGRIRKNGSTYVGRGTTVNYTRNSTNDNGSLSPGSFLLKLRADDYIELMTDQQGDGPTCNIQPNDNYIRLTFFRSEA